VVESVIDFSRIIKLSSITILFSGRGQSASNLHRRNNPESHAIPRSAATGLLCSAIVGDVLRTKAVNNRCGIKADSEQHSSGSENQPIIQQAPMKTIPTDHAADEKENIPPEKFCFD
jgi:hypothetical protein